MNAAKWKICECYFSSLQSSSLGLVKLKNYCYEGEDSNIVCLYRFFSFPGLFGQLWTPFSCLYWVNRWRRGLGSNVVFTMTLVLVLQTHPWVPIDWLVFTVSFCSTSFTSHFHVDRDPRTDLPLSLVFWASNNAQISLTAVLYCTGCPGTDWNGERDYLTHISTSPETVSIGKWFLNSVFSKVDIASCSPPKIRYLHSASVPTNKMPGELTWIN